ncbi:MAG: hypothetical protein QOF76_2302 [Solirubrobacteraceae bacterium]|jgi:hypothetical protein|nr:hypothetical protein [Solirubrobacteraceae bacterium]
MLSDTIRAQCQAVAATARHVTIHPDAASYDGGTTGLDPALHRLDAPPEEVARYVLVLDAINFGSGWFGELGIDTNGLTQALTDRGVPWTAGELRTLRPADVAETLGLNARHELTHLYATALRQLGDWLGDAPLVDRLGDSAQAFAAELVAGMSFFADPGFHKRAQIAANDLVLAGVAAFADVDSLTVFADNLLPHVLRHDGVLEYAPALAERIDAGEALEHGSVPEREIRACTVYVCELLAQRAGVPARTLDNWLWHRGLDLPGTPHRCLTVAY